LKSLWGGPHGENQKKKWKNKKTKKHQYSETLGLPFPIPNTSVFFSCCFSKFFVFFQVFFFSKFFFLAFRLRRSVGGGVVSERRASNMPCAANVEGFN
jgi:hypothetical protein